MSSSLDGSVKVWSLDRFHLVYHFNLPFTLTFSKLFGRSKHVAVAMKERLVIYGVHLIGEHYLTPEVSIVGVKTGYMSGSERD